MPLAVPLIYRLPHRSFSYTFALELAPARLLPALHTSSFSQPPSVHVNDIRTAHNTQDRRAQGGSFPPLKPSPPALFALVSPPLWWCALLLLLRLGSCSTATEPLLPSPPIVTTVVAVLCALCLRDRKYIIHNTIHDTISTYNT
jgi:hypothetical protein